MNNNLTSSIIKEVQNTLQQYNAFECNNQKLVVAVSGGPDSICLLDILNKLTKVHQFQINVLHINHLLRGKESDLDEMYVKEFCANLSITVHTESINVIEEAKNLKQSIETTARILRYKKLLDYCLKIDSSFLLTAHNANDSVETVMMNFIRGTGLRGLKGILKQRQIDGVNLIRPLINIEKKDILAYLNKNNIKSRFDSTNNDTQFTRNNIRKNTLPILEKLNPGLHKNLLQLSNISSEINGYFEKQISYHLDKLIISTTNNLDNNNILIFDRKYFNDLEKILQSYLIDALYNLTTTNKSRHLDYQQVQNITSLVNSKTSKKLNLPENITLEVNYNFVRIYQNQSNSNKEIIDPSTINTNGSITKFDNWELQTEKIENINSSNKLNMIITKAKTNPYEGFFDYDCIKSHLLIRYRNSGDIFQPIGLSGHQTLKKFMSNNHIPISERNFTPLITNESNVLWVVPYQTSQFAKVTSKTKTVLKISVLHT